MACSNATSPSNTICVTEQEREEGLCPINHIDMIERNQASTLDLSIYSVEDFSDELALVYSKTLRDALPITSTKLATS